MTLPMLSVVYNMLTVFPPPPPPPSWEKKIIIYILFFDDNIPMSCGGGVGYKGGWGGSGVVHSKHIIYYAEHW